MNINEQKKIAGIVAAVTDSVDLLIAQDYVNPINSRVCAIRDAMRELRDMSLPKVSQTAPAPRVGVGIIIGFGSRHRITAEYARSILSAIPANEGAVSLLLRKAKGGDTIRLYTGAKLLYVGGGGTRLSSSRLNGGHFYIEGSDAELKPFI